MSKIPKAKFVPTACTYLNNVRDLRINEDTPGAQNVQNLFGAITRAGYVCPRGWKEVGPPEAVFDTMPHGACAWAEEHHSTDPRFDIDLDSTMIHNQTFFGIGSTANVGATAGFSMTEVGTPLGLSSLGILQGGCKGGLHGCAMVNVSGIVKVFCWGLNGYGQLGIGSTSNVGDSTPFTVTEVQGLSVLGEVRQMHCGGLYTCATVRNAVGVDKVVCWGHNNSVQLGVGSTTAVGDVPGFVLNEVLGLADKGQLVVMEAGWEHNCTIVRTGGSQQKVYCWGLNNFGQVGVGSTINVGYVPGFTLSEV